MINRIADSIWIVTADDPSLPRFGGRDGDIVTIHGYVEWGGQKFTAYFSHVMILTEDRARRCKDPEVLPVPDNEAVRAVAASAIMLEFWPLLWTEPRKMEELSARLSQVQMPSRTHEVADDETMRELRDAINSVDDEGNEIVPGTDGGQ